MADAVIKADHKTIVSTQGQSYLNWIETHFDIQRRLYDYQFSLARTPSDLEQRHQEFMQTYNTTAHQGLLADPRLPPLPVEILGAAQGRRYAQEVLAEKFAHALFPRTTNRYGCVTLHSYHFYVESGVPHGGRRSCQAGLGLLGGAKHVQTPQCDSTEVDANLTT